MLASFCELLSAGFYMFFLEKAYSVILVSTIHRYRQYEKNTQMLRFHGAMWDRAGVTGEACTYVYLYWFTFIILRPARMAASQK